MPEHAKASTNPLRRLSRKQLTITIGCVVAVLGIAIGFIVTSGSGTPSKASAPPASTTTSTPALASNLCPLTATPAPGGKVPQRPAVLVKIGNEPGEGLARPQGGLNEADIVFDTPAEGFIMRYMAAYQCNPAPSIGPTRSVRWVDYHLARMFRTPILSYAGGINPNLDAEHGDKWISPANLIAAQSEAGTRISSRSGDDNLYTSTAKLYALYPKGIEPPLPVFQYSASLPASAVPTTSATIDFSGGTDVVWKWNPSGNDWIHTYTDSGTDIDTDTGAPVTTSNIVEMDVNYKIGPYSEHGCCSGDIESITIGSGPGYVLRNGKRVAVTWHRPDLGSPLTFTDAQGQAVALTPGRTWVELIVTSVATNKADVTFAP